jgi:hypothetical protein
MNINVSPDARGHFWDEPPAGAMEFWAFSRFAPPCRVGDELVFRFDGVAVARAVVHAIEEPGRGACEASGKYENAWKVFWRPESFEDLRGVSAKDRPPPTSGTRSRDRSMGQGRLFAPPADAPKRGRML